MPDTIRTLAELNAIFADNLTGDASTQDIRDLVVSLMCHAEIGSGAKAPIVLGTGYEPLDFNIVGAIERGFNADGVSRSIKNTPVNMVVEMSMEVFFKGDAGEEYDFTVFKDPTGTPVEIGRMARQNVAIVAAAQTMHLTWSTSVQLAQGDEIQAGVRSNGNNFELLFGLLRVRRIGVE